MNKISSSNNTIGLISEADRVELIVCSPHQPVRLISAKLAGQIRSLQRLWPNSPKKFIFNGSILAPEMTFDFYGIRNGDTIIALSKESHENYTTTGRWITLTRDNENFSESIKSMIHPRTAREASRLKDLHLMKLERKPKLFMKLCEPFIEKDTESKVEQSTLFLPDQATEPSTSALPVFW